MDLLFFTLDLKKIHGWSVLLEQKLYEQNFAFTLGPTYWLTDKTATAAHKGQMAWHVTHTGRTDKRTKKRGWVGSLPSWQAEQNTWRSSRTGQSGGRGRCSSCVRPARRHPHQPANQNSQIVKTRKLKAQALWPGSCRLQVLTIKVIFRCNLCHCHWKAALRYKTNNKN